MGVARCGYVPADSLKEISLAWGRIPCDQRDRQEPGIESGASPQSMRTGIRLLFHRRSKKKERIQRDNPPLAPQKVRSGAPASLVWWPLCVPVCGYVDVMCVHTFAGVRLGVWVTHVMVCCTYINEYKLVCV